MVEEKRQVRRIPVRKVSSEEMRSELDAKIQDFERRYERPSERMLQLITWGEVKETAEILEWMQAFHVRRWLKEKETPTTGTPTTITERSTISE